MGSQTIQTQIREMRSGRLQGSRVAVLGSNLGWQCFYCALTFGIQADGYEILKRRHDAAQNFADKFKIPGVRLFNQDITKGIKFQDVAIVYLTDLLWDETVRTAVAKQIAAHAALGTVV